MSNYVSITDQTSKQLIADDHFGEITDFYMTSGSAGSAAALYDGTSSAAPLLLLQEAASNASQAITNMKVQFGAHGVYAVVNSNVLALTIHGSWSKKLPATVLVNG